MLKKLFFLILAFISVVNGFGEGNLIAQNGEIDFLNTDIENSIFTLRGQWEFYWDQLLYPGDFDSINNEKQLILIPGRWNHQFDYSPSGFATYRLKLKHLPAEKSYSLKLTNVYAAFKLFFNGKLCFENGRVADNRENYRPSNQPRIIDVTSHAGINELIIQVANFDDLSGGIDEVLLGKKELITRQRDMHLALDLLIFGGLILMAFYYFILYFLRPKNRELLFFSLFSLFFGLRMLLMGERFFYLLFGGLGYQWLFKLEFLVLPLALIAFSFYFRDLFKTKWYNWVHWGFSGICGVVSLVVLALPLAGYSLVYPLFQIAALVTGASMLVAAILAYFDKNEGAMIFIVGFCALLLVGVNDVLNYNHLINTGYFLSSGIFAFILVQAVLVTRRLTKAFSSTEQLTQKLISLDQLKDSALANTSHEIKTPLAGIIGLAEALYLGDYGRLNPQQAKNISLMISSGRRLYNLVNDIMDFSRAKTRELDLHRKPVDLREVVEIVFVFSKPLLSNKKISLINSIGSDFPLVSGDENRLQQILSNIISNSIKFTESGKVEVRAYQSRNMARIEVSDTGVGIAEEKLPRIFDSFEKMDAQESRRYGGVGLGLSITKQLIDLHGGEIFVDSQVGKGTTFTFTLPISADQTRVPMSEDAVSELIELQDDQFLTARDIQSGARSAPEKKMRVMVVDDESSHHEVINSYLQNTGYEPFHFTSGHEALEALAKDKFDIILLDIMMPGMTGHIVCKKVREKFESNTLPIILMSARNFLTDLLEGFSSGANDFMTKPIFKAELLARLTTHTRLSKISRAYSRFVPSGFLKLLGRDSIVDVRRGDQTFREMTVLFCDIRSFTTLSEKLTPKENFDFLNSYFEKMSPVIHRNHGYIDKYIGDEIMALFPSDPEDALKAALGMMRSLNTYNTFRGKMGYDPIFVGIGIHLGPIILGTIGDDTRLQGTVISDSVNVASRLEGVTKIYGGSIIISANIFFSLQDPSVYNYRFLGRVQVKGKRDFVPIYEVFDFSEDGELKNQSKDVFERALQAYFTKDFEMAENLFYDILKNNPQDRAARLYYNRSLQYRSEGVSTDWDGVERVDFK